MREITIDTPQGIGDLIWVYRKLSLYYDKININVLVVGHNEVQERSRNFLSTLDMVGKVNFKKVTGKEYGRVASGFYKMEEIKNEYSVNAWLEKGIHIDDIDKFQVNWNINLKLGSLNISKEYVLLYVSGCNHNSTNYQMSSNMWADIVLSVCKKIDTYNCILIGAQYDEKKLVEINNIIKDKLNTNVISKASIQDTTKIISEAKYFISYQSGLCVIAEELNIPTLMIYFPENKNLINSWNRKENINRNLFCNHFFGEPVETIIESTKKHIDSFCGVCNVN
ncbi:MAG: glycosyltransferase family 9 protein [Candidatus Paceibacterota bacterium]|jgi:ADP-heptose:LPS heptosyltransferase